MIDNGSGNDALPEDTDPLPESMLTSVRARGILEEPSVTQKYSLKITYLKFH